MERKHNFRVHFDQNKELSEAQLARFESLAEDLQNHRVELRLQQEELDRMSRALDKKQHEFDELRDNAPVAYLTHDSGGFVFEASRRARAMLGLQPCQKDFNLLELFTPKVRELFGFHMQQARANQRPSSIEIEFFRTGEEKIFILVETRYSGNVYETVMVDVSTRKHSEQMQERLESQLMHSQKMELLDRLSGGIAHDFNNILQVLLLQAEQTQMLIGESSPEASDSIDQICETAARGVELTRRLLVFSRKRALEKVRGDLNEIIESSEEFLCRSVGDDWKLIFDLSPHRLGVWVDPVQIEQVLLNLCVNSKDAMPEGGVIEISTRKTFIESRVVKSGLTLIPGPYAVLSIKDNGTGIASEIVNQVFEPYFSTKELGKGTGLGLAIVHSIMRQHSGAVEIVKSDKDGTQVDLYLFSFHLADKKKIPATTPDSNMEFTGNVLVCDDEPTILSVLAMTLRDLGLTVYQASDGIEAIKRIRELDQIDLLLTDVVIPGCSGREICEEFRRKFKHSAVVFMSGHGDSVLDEQFLRDSHATFLPKPFKLGSLKDKLGLQLLSANND